MPVRQPNGGQPKPAHWGRRQSRWLLTWPAALLVFRQLLGTHNVPLHGCGANLRFGSKADIGEAETDVRFTPKSGHRNSVVECPLCAKSGHWAAQQLTELFDQLVGEGEQTRRDGETKCPRSRQVDGQFQFGWLQYRQIGGLFTHQNLAGQNPALPV